MAMTRKHHLAIAKLISDSTNMGPNIRGHYVAQTHTLISDLVRLFEEDNPGFNYFKFYDAATKKEQQWEEGEKRRREAG